MNFVESLERVLDEDYNESTTENGALGYKTTGKTLLDMNFAVTSLRNASDYQIANKFSRVFEEDSTLAVKWLFYIADVREGAGERRLFRVCLKWLAENRPEMAQSLLPLVPEYTRWDNLLPLLDTSLADATVALIKDQLDRDIKSAKRDEPVSLLAKWLPSENASSKETRRLAYILMRKLAMTERQYRKSLSRLRSYLKVVEVKMSAKEWSTIDYSEVPSRANLVYNQAFLKHDEERRTAYLDSLKKGETKINAGVLFPHDIVHKYMLCKHLVRSEDVTLEELWKALPDYVGGNGNTLCVADGSGSMARAIGDTKVTCLDVANALAIYFAEKSGGQFKDKYITFSEHPQLVDFSSAKTLKEKLEIAMKHTEVANTDVEKVFDLILRTAIDHSMLQDDLPQNVLILSDMEFDDCVECSSYDQPNKKLFKEFAERYQRYGYKLPRLVFWNICSRTGTIPVKENDLGVALVSGFSPVIAKMVLSSKIDPLECLLEQLNSDRYKLVEDAIRK